MLRVGLPLGHVDLKAVQQDLSSLPWVKNVHVKRVWPNRIVVSVTEYQPFARWIQKEGARILTAEGVVVQASIPSQEKLLWVLGKKIGTETIVFFKNLKKADKGLTKRVAGLRLFPSGRFDLYLKNGSLIKLPACKIVQALERFKIFEKHHILRPKECIDLRSPYRLVLTPNA